MNWTKRISLIIALVIVLSLCGLGQNTVVVGGNSGAIVDTVGVGGFWGFYLTAPASVAAAVIVPGANNVYCYQFVLPYTVTVGKVDTELTTPGAASSKYGVAIYDRNKNKLFETGAIAADTVAQINTTTLSSPATLTPDTYYLCDTTSDAAAQFRVGLPANSAASLFGNSTARGGLAGNAAPTPGTFPATIGTITNSLARWPILAYFER